jgi:hypothetical protein
MASDEGKPAGPVALRIKLRYDDVDAMVQRFATNVGRSGLFLPTRSLQPIGTEVKFELRIADDTPVLVGLGKVRSAKAPDPDNPRAAFGMAIELMRVTREGREVIIRMLERRRELGLPEVAIPMPEDIETARRIDVDTQPRVDSGAIVRDAMPRIPTPPPSDSLLTSPRPTSGPLGTARGGSDRRSAPMLAPEPMRPKRPKLADLVAQAERASASGPAMIPLDLGDDFDVDIGKAMARARALAGDDLDLELEALRESSAAPIEVSVEAASAELARQLGGTAISRRDRSARWAPPPAIATGAATAAATATEIVPDPTPIAADVPRRLPTASGEMDRLAEEQAIAIASRVVAVVTEPEPEPEPEPVAVVVGVAAVVVAEPQVTTEPERALAVEDDAELSSFERALDAARVHTGQSEPAPEPESEEEDIPELDSVDLELADDLPGESTQIGENPIGYETIPAAPAVLDHDGTLGLEEPPPPAAYDPFAHEHPAEAADFSEEEISDLDVLAEADADDDDLLAANGERDSSGHPIVAADEPEPIAAAYVAAFHEPEEVEPVFRDPAPSYPRVDAYRRGTPTPSYDFANRLDLDDADEFDEAHVHGNAPVERRASSAAYAIAARYPSSSGTFDDPHRGAPEDFDEPPLYTQQEDPAYEDPEVEFDEQHAFGRRAFELAEEPEPTPVPEPAADLDLENALSTLDVDLDHLEVPHDRRRPVQRARLLPGMPPARSSANDVPTVRPGSTQPKQVTQPLPRSRLSRAKRSDEADDGVLIDFEDDDED